MKKALLLIDIQNDFCRGGALEVKEGNQVVPIANQLMPHFDLVVATQDWHPATHGSFAANHIWTKPGQVIDLDGLEQILWPIHCVQESFGAEFVQELNEAGIHHVFQKGTDPKIDSYSGFFDNGHRKATGLGDFLKAEGVTDLVILGLATDYCVKFTVLDALDLGFNVQVVQDACRAVNMEAGDDQKAFQEMANKGAQLIYSKDLLPA